MEFIIDCNLVSLLSFTVLIYYLFTQAFRITERVSLHRLVKYLQPKASESAVPLQTMITENVAHKTETLDQIDTKTIKVQSTSNKLHGTDHLLTGYLLLNICHL